MTPAINYIVVRPSLMMGLIFLTIALVGAVEVPA